MSNVYKGKIKVYPSGKASVVFSLSHASNSARVHGAVNGCEQLYTCFETGEIFDLGSRAKLKQTPSVQVGQSGTASGYGGLGHKSEASWKSCRNVRERMAACELEYKVRNCGLLTVTIPSIDPRAYEAIARYSSEAMNRLNLELNRYFKDEKFGRVTAWEYQARGALHAHILIAADSVHRIKNKDFADHFADAWYRILSGIERKFECNMFLSSSGKRWDLSSLKKVVNKKSETVFVNFQKVRKSVVAYLGSYLATSNHEGKEKDKQKLRKDFFPIATWFQWNRKATELYNKYLYEEQVCECETDRRKDIERLLKNLKKRLSDNVVLAEKTDYIDSRNRYNLGFYFIPIDNVESCHAIGFLRSFAEDCRKNLAQSLIHFWIPELTDSEKFELEYDLSWADKPDSYFRDDKLYVKKNNQINQGIELAWLGLFMLEFLQEKADVLTANPYLEYKQMELC